MSIERRQVWPSERGAHLKHRQQQMLFSTFVLVSVQRKHDRLQERVDFGERDEPTERCNMPRFSLKQEEQVGVLLHPLFIRIRSFLGFDVFKRLCDFPLLIGGHAVLDQECDPAVKVADVALEHKVLFGLGGNARLEIA